MLNTATLPTFGKQLLALARILRLDTSGTPAVAAAGRPSATRAGPMPSAPAKVW